MHWVDKREEVTDRHGLYPVELLQGRDGLHHLRLVEGLQDVARSIEPFTDAHTLPAWSQKAGCFGIEKQIVHLRTFLPTNLQHVLEPRGHEDAGNGPLLLQDGIRGNGGTVDETLHGCSRLSGERQHAGHALLHPLHQIAGCARDFREEQALLILQADDIGKRATNVNGDLKHGERSLSR